MYGRPGTETAAPRHQAPARKQGDMPHRKDCKALSRLPGQSHCLDGSWRKGRFSHHLRGGKEPVRGGAQRDDGTNSSEKTSHPRGNIIIALPVRQFRRQRDCAGGRAGDIMADTELSQVIIWVRGQPAGHKANAQRHQPCHQQQHPGQPHAPTTGAPGIPRGGARRFRNRHYPGTS